MNAMYKYYGKVDKFGRLHLPKNLRKNLHLENRVVEIDVEKRQGNRQVLVLEPTFSSSTNWVEHIAEMNLPLPETNWKKIMREIEAAHP
mgnify:CR=1 FL=1